MSTGQPHGHAGSPVLGGRLGFPSRLVQYPVVLGHVESCMPTQGPRDPPLVVVPLRQDRRPAVGNPLRPRTAAQNYPWRRDHGPVHVRGRKQTPVRTNPNGRVIVPRFSQRLSKTVNLTDAQGARGGMRLNWPFDVYV